MRIVDTKIHNGIYDKFYEKRHSFIDNSTVDS